MYNKITGPASVDDKKIINNLYDPIVCLYLRLAPKSSEKVRIRKEETIEWKIGNIMFVSEM